MRIRRVQGQRQLDPVIQAIRNQRLPATGGTYTQNRDAIRTNQQAMTSQMLRLSFFTALRTETVTQIRTWTGAAAAAATPTLCRMGVYEVDASGNLGNLKAHANDTALWNGLNQTNTKTLTSSLNLVAGRIYCAAALCVTATTVPQLISCGPIFYLSVQSELAANPPVGAALPAQSDLPASIAIGALGAATGGDFTPLFRLLP